MEYMCTNQWNNLGTNFLLLRSYTYLYTVGQLHWFDYWLLTIDWCIKVGAGRQAGNSGISISFALQITTILWPSSDHTLVSRNCLTIPSLLEFRGQDAQSELWWWYILVWFLNTSLAYIAPFTLNEGFGGLGTELGAYTSSLVSEPDPLGTRPSGSETTSSFPFLLHSLSLSLEGPLLTKEFAPVDAVLDEGKKDREIAANDFCHSLINSGTTC